MRITIIGTGYVGLVSGACFAKLGHDVACLDADAAKISALQSGIIPIYEPGLDDLVSAGVRDRRIRFVSSYGDAIADADVIFIAVGTPPREPDGQADTSAVFAAARSLAPRLAGRTVIATKSTVPIGTGGRLEALLRSEAPDADISVVSNPEFLREGSAIRDFLAPDRIVVGTETRWAADSMRTVYGPLTADGVPLLIVDRATAEITKYAANSFLATKIAFINEVADLCERAGGDVGSVAWAIGLDHRIGPEFLKAGPGFGGSCFPKDTCAFVTTSEELGVPQRIVSAAIEANHARKRELVQRVAEAAGGSLRGKTVAVLGLTFKARTDDLRDSPSLMLVPDLSRHGANVRAHDPAGLAQARERIAGAEFVEDPYDALDGADVAVVLTDWPDYQALDPERIAAAMGGRVVVDLRNLLNVEPLTEQGLTVLGVGRRDVVAPADRPGAARVRAPIGQAAE